MFAEWSNFDDYMEKYGPFKDPETHSYKAFTWRRFHINGLMLRDGLIDVATYVEYLGDTPALMWKKYKGIVEEYRRGLNNPTWYLGWEILAKEIEKYREQQGWGPSERDMPTMKIKFNDQ
jgi:hypothetical protein